VAKQQPERRFTLLYDKVCRQDILQEAWQRVKSNKGAAGVDQMDIDAIRDYGEERFLSELEQELRSRRYRTALVWCAGCTYRSPDNRGRLGRWASRR
jgi:RNA-directed DNA polymerase